MRQNHFSDDQAELSDDVDSALNNLFSRKSPVLRHFRPRYDEDGAERGFAKRKRKRVRKPQE